MDVEVDARGLGVGPERRGAALVGQDGLLPPLRVADEELAQRGAALAGRGDGVVVAHVRADPQGGGGERRSGGHGAM